MHLFIPVISNGAEPLDHIIETLDAQLNANDALALCVDGDWVLEFELVARYRACNKFILEAQKEDGESNNSTM